MPEEEIQVLGDLKHSRSQTTGPQIQKPRKAAALLLRAMRRSVLPGMPTGVRLQSTKLLCYVVKSHRFSLYHVHHS